MFFVALFSAGSHNKTVLSVYNSAPQQGRAAGAPVGGSGVSPGHDPQRIVKPMKRTGPRAATVNGR